jgi:hypothetical protein
MRPLRAGLPGKAVIVFPRRPQTRVNTVSTRCQILSGMVSLDPALPLSNDGCTHSVRGTAWSGWRTRRQGTGYEGAHDYGHRCQRPSRPPTIHGAPVIHPASSVLISWSRPDFFRLAFGAPLAGTVRPAGRIDWLGESRRSACTTPIAEPPHGRRSCPAPVGAWPLRHPSHPRAWGWRAVQSELGDDIS